MIKTKNFFTICFSGIIILFCIILSGCRTSFEDFIPESLGAPEGLFLYNGNIRSLTDGSEQTEILSEITLGETVYESCDFEIDSIAYITETHEIFYSVSVEEKCLLWHVNYKSKISELLYEFPEGEQFYLDANDYYVLIRNKSEGILFDKNAEIIGENFCGFTLNQDVLYRFVDTAFEFWKDGNLTKIDIQFEPDYSYTYYLGNYFYIFGKEKAVSVSLISGETNYLDLLQYTKKDEVYPYRKVVMDNALYFVLYGNFNTLWKAENGTFQVLHTYSDENCTGHSSNATYESTELIIKEYGKGILNFRYSCCWRKSDGHHYHELRYYYDAETGKVKEGNQSISKSEPEKLIVGDYSFYITSLYYGHPLWGSFAGETGRFYYLNREKDGKKEVLQYKYVSSHGDETSKIYDDICEF